MNYGRILFSFCFHLASTGWNVSLPCSLSDLAEIFMCLSLCWHWFKNRCYSLPFLHLLNFMPDVGKNQMNCQPLHLIPSFILILWTIFLLEISLDEKKQHVKIHKRWDRVNHCPYISSSSRTLASKSIAMVELEQFYWKMWRFCEDCEAFGDGKIFTDLAVVRVVQLFHG